jgi:[acyl-carrier-protein] S-malonyltransferase|tara:strand:+ start:483 stop:1421 length:939 start_codon:yes stop_codon:yes gene_type:complete
MKNNLAFVFPGQGSQKIGMLKALGEAHAVVLDTFAEASSVLNYDVWKLVQDGTQDEINLTERTQPLLLTSSVAIWRLWESMQGPLPAQVAGHSLGEWSALVCAGVVDFSDAVSIVRARGAYMQDAVPAGVGAMAAIIGLDDDIISTACAEAQTLGVIAAVNYNAPGQVVIAGEVKAVDQAISLCKAMGAKRALSLPVSAPFHTSLMKPAAERLTALVESTVFSAPVIPVIHNVNGQVQANTKIIKSLMIEQIYSPVRWVDCVIALRDRGAEYLVECGPGRVLNGLSKRIDRELRSFATDDINSLENALSSLK